MGTNSMVVMGVFEDRMHAERAINRLAALGVERRDMSIVAHPYAMHDATTGEKLMQKLEPRSGVALGPATLVATLVGIGLFALPLGGLLVAGPIAMIGGAAAAFGAPLLSAESFADLGVPRRDAKLAMEAIRRGGIVMVAHVAERIVRACAEAIDRSGAVDLYYRAGQWESEGWTYEPNAPLWTHAQIEKERLLRDPMRGIPRFSAPSYA